MSSGSRSWRARSSASSAIPIPSTPGRWRGSSPISCSREAASSPPRTWPIIGCIDRKPVTGTYRGLTIISSPPPSSGGIVLIELLNILEGYDLKSAGLDSAASIHLITEAYRRAFFDRAEFMGDPAYTDSPMMLLLDKRYAAAWRSSILPQDASPSLALARPTTFPQLTRYAAAHPVLGQAPESRQTTHYSVVDAAGNAVSVTTTLNAWYGSGVTAGHLGFLLNDEMDDFASKVGVPNMFGVLQGSANAVGPGKRPLSSMTPTIVLKDGKLWLVLGSPGGPTIITTVANVLIDAADYGLNIKQAVAAPRFHQQWMPDEIFMEPDRFSPDTLRLLAGHGLPHRLRGRGRCRVHRGRPGHRRAPGSERSAYRGRPGRRILIRDDTMARP